MYFLETTYNKKYELTLVAVFFFCYGLIFLDRLAISYLMPIIQQNVGITNAGVGMLGLVTSGCYAISSIVFGNLSDRWGYKKRILLPFVLGTAIFAGAGAFTHTMTQLIIIRAFVGLCEGPIAPLMYSLIAMHSHPNTLGRNVGILNASVNLIAVTLGPIFITQLVAHYTWQHTFLLSSIPTFFVLVAMIFLVKEHRVLPEKDEKKASFGDVLSYRNIVIACIVNILVMCVYWTFLLFAPLYLVNVGKLSVQTMGWVSSLMGLLTFIYSIFVPKLSDNFGRKPVLFICLALTIITPFFMWALPGSMFCIVLYVIFGGITGPCTPIYMQLIPMETVPNHLKATALALVMGCGDFLGAAVYPYFAGRIGDAAGLPAMMLIAAIITVVVVLLSLLFTETHPRQPKVSASAPAAK